MLANASFLTAALSLCASAPHQPVPAASDLVISTRAAVPATNPTCTPVPATTAAREHRIEIHIDRKKYDSEGALELLRGPARDAVDFWLDWAMDQEFHMAVSSDRRVLFMTERDFQLKDRMELIEETIDYIDDFTSGFEIVVPEEDGETRKSIDVSKSQERSKLSIPPRAGLPPIESDIAVIIEFQQLPQQASAVALLAHEHDYLRSWQGRAAKHAGLTLENPLFGAFMQAPEVEETEYSANNELVHRTTQLLMTRRYGHLPYWIRTGLCWKAEWDLNNEALYCFPNREGFVGVAEHDSWAGDVSRAFKKRKKDPLRRQELLEWPNNTFKQDYAQVAFGFADMLIEKHSKKIGPILEDMRLAHEDGSLVVSDTGAWSRTAPYDITSDVQMEILERHLGDDFLEVATKYFMKM